MTPSPTVDRGSTIPLILGIFIIALMLVAGSVAAGDAFVQQSALQDECDGAAVAAANSADVGGSRAGGSPGGYLELGQVQQATQLYVSRDPARAPVQMQARLGIDQTTVVVDCVATESIAFGSWFGFSGGITHHVTAAARAPLAEN